jgi:hypothetical protein
LRAALRSMDSNGNRRAQLDRLPRVLGECIQHPTDVTTMKTPSTRRQHGLYQKCSKLLADKLHLRLLVLKLRTAARFDLIFRLLIWR